MDDLERRLRRVEDELAIQRLKARYARLCDDGYDADGIAALFTADGVWDGGSLFGRADGAEAIRRHFQGASERIPWALHFTLNPEIHVADDGATARATWYLWQPCVRRRQGRDEQAWLAGTYRDDYVKIDGQWRFQTVRVDARWLEGPPAGAVKP